MLDDELVRVELEVLVDDDGVCLLYVVPEDFCVGVVRVVPELVDEELLERVDGAVLVEFAGPAEVLVEVEVDFCVVLVLVRVELELADGLLVRVDGEVLVEFAGPPDVLVDVELFTDEPDEVLVDGDVRLEFAGP